VDLISGLLRAKGLGGVTVSTVDSCKGSEARLVIVSFVRTGKQTIGFLSDQRRLNVALTRAKHKLVCVGNVEHGLAQVRAKGAETVRKLAEDVIDRQLLAKKYEPKGNVVRISHDYRRGGHQQLSRRPRPPQNVKPPTPKGNNRSLRYKVDFDALILAMQC
jgi:superfamily I DNA and/or RNA helicase